MTGLDTSGLASNREPSGFAFDADALASLAAAEEQDRSNSSSPTEQLRQGGDFLLNAPDHVPALWGSGTEVLWAAGESLMVTGPQGVGKSFLAQQLVLARLGIRSRVLLNQPVAQTSGRLLYIAADRPRQIARSMRRMVRSEDAETLNEQLFFWVGPLPFNLATMPARLLPFVQETGATTVVVDSLKDIAVGLTSDEVGAAVNIALGSLIAAGIEVVVIHHTRKANADNKAPKQLADVYGSTWLTAGSGSVICLWGDPGDPVVELRHLKQPAEVVGPLEIHHDHDAASTTLRDRPTVATVLAGAATALTARQIASLIHSTPSPAQLEQVRRRLKRLAAEGQAHATETDDGSTVWARGGCVDPPVDPPREGPRNPTTPINTPHAGPTPLPEGAVSLKGDGLRGVHAPPTDPGSQPARELWPRREGGAR